MGMNDPVIDQRIDRIESDVQYIRAEVAAISQALYKGNGHSVLTRVAVLEQMAREGERWTSRLSNRAWALLLAGIGVIGSVVGGVTTALIISGVIVKGG